MRRYFSFAMTLAAALGFATVGWGQAGGGGGAGGGGAGGASASGGAGVSGGAGGGSVGAGNVGAGPTAGAGADTAGTAGAAGTATGVGRAGAAGTAGTAGTATGVGRAGAAGTRRGAGAAGGVGVAAGASGRGTNAFSPRSNISQNPFFSDRGVRQQLNLNDNQFNTLNRAYQDAYGAYNRGLNNLNSNLTPQQRAAQLQNLENEFNNSFNRSVDSTINNPQLRTRFDQLNRQFIGINAFNNPAIQRQLNLTPQQQTQIRQLAAQYQQQLQAGGTGTNGVNLSQAQWNALSAQIYDQVNGILTPQQQQTWSQLTGQRYNFPSSLYMNNVSGASGTLANRPITPNTEPRFFPTNNGTTANGTTSTNTNGTSADNPSSTTTTTGTSSTGVSGSASGNSSGIGTSGTSTNGTSVNNPGSTATPTGGSSTGTTGSAGAGTGGTTSGGNSGTSGASGSGS